MEKRRSMWALTWVPRPRMKRPPERSWRSHETCAVVIGEREKAIAMEVPRSRVRVLFAATASGRNESCLVSLVQSPAKPRDSAPRPASSMVGRCLPSTASPASNFITASLGDQDQLAGSLAAFEVAVRLLGLGELVGAADADVEVVLTDPGEEALRPPEELLAGRGVPGESGPGDEETTLLVEDLEVKRRHGAA